MELPPRFRRQRSRPVEIAKGKKPEATVSSCHECYHHSGKRGLLRVGIRVSASHGLIVRMLDASERTLRLTSTKRFTGHVTAKANGPVPR